MAKLSVLGGSNSTYSVIIHTAAPTGNNSAGVLWSDAVKNSGRSKTVMPVGTGPGQVSQADSDAIAAGTLLEGQFQWQDDPTMTNPQRIADVTLRATQLAAELTAQITSSLTYFGFTQ